MARSCFNQILQKAVHLFFRLCHFVWYNSHPDPFLGVGTRGSESLTSCKRLSSDQRHFSAGQSLHFKMSSGIMCRSFSQDRSYAIIYTPFDAAESGHYFEYQIAITFFFEFRVIFQNMDKISKNFLKVSDPLVPTPMNGIRWELYQTKW